MTGRISWGPRLVVAALLAAGVVPAGERDGASRPRVDLLRSDRGAVELRVSFPAPEVGAVSRDGRHDVFVPGLSRERIVGEPALPFLPVLVAVPPGASLRLHVDEGEPAHLPGVRAGPFDLPDPDAVDRPTATDAPRGRPAAPVELDFDGYLRDRRVVRLVFHPITIEPSRGGTVFHRTLRARLDLEGDVDGFLDRGTGADGHAEAPEPDGDEFLALYRRVLLNESRIDRAAYAAALVRRRRAPAGRATSAPTSAVRGFAGSTPSPAKIPVDREGPWAVSFEELLAVGIDAAGVPIADLSLRAGGIPVPRLVVDGGDGVFGHGDRVEFYGVGIAGEIDHDTNVYRLAFDEGPGLPFAVRDATPTGGVAPVSFPHVERFEQNLTFFTNSADGDGDRFGWERITASGSGTASRSYPFALVDLDPAAATVRIRVRMYQRAGTHTTAVLLNGVDLLDARSWSAGDVTHDVVTAASNLVPGTNTLTVQIEGSASNQLVFNWFDIEYPRLFRAAGDTLAFTAELAAPATYEIAGFTTPDVVVYDVTDAAAPVRLDAIVVTGGPGAYAATFTDTLGGSRRFVTRAGAASPGGPILADTASTLGGASHGADLIVLSYREFLDELAPLVAAREAEGLRVVLVDLEDVYDEWAFGRPDPAAIPAFLSHAIASWQAPAPAYLLLVGNATLDPRQLLPDSVPPLMPTGLFEAPSLGLAASDHALVAVVGDDPLPDLLVGRIPAETESEVTAAVERIVGYGDVPPGLLNRRLLLAADDDDIQFEAIQEDLVSLYLSSTTIPAARAYLRRLGVAATNQAIRDAMNDGALLVNFLGHGNVHNWAAEDVFLDTTDIPLLSNSDRPFFLTTLNCINGFHAGPREPNLASLAEQVVLAPAGGAIAAWSPSALGQLDEYRLMLESLFRLLFVDRVQRIGAATTLAKVEAYALFGASVVNLHEMTLFGDPTTVLRVDGDADGWTDQDEAAAGLDPRDADTDDDGLADGAEPAALVDVDGDGRVGAADFDADDDGLTDGLESGVVVPGAGTDVGRGRFTADSDPSSTTDPTDSDTDGGGAPDGAEDRDANGSVDPSETDPDDPADDPTCSAAPPAEVAGLALSKDGGDVVLAWSGQEGVDPCVLYRLHTAAGAPPSSFAPWIDEGIVTLPVWRHLGALGAEGDCYYLVEAVSPAGAGPLGHYGR